MFRTVQSTSVEPGDVANGMVSRRTVMIGSASAFAIGMIAKTGLTEALAQESTDTGTPSAGHEGHDLDLQTVRARLEEFGYLWSATSPATHVGDTFQLTATNPGSTPVKLLTLTIVMDHRAHVNKLVINEEVELAAGESHQFTATNDYGTANHFSTRIISTAADPSTLTLDVTVTDANGTESASFNERAFMVDSREDLQQAREARRAARRALRERLHKRRKHLRGGHFGGDAGSDEAEAEGDLDS